MLFTGTLAMEELKNTNLKEGGDALPGCLSCYSQNAPIFF
jgi:hypothetical protein